MDLSRGLRKNVKRQKRKLFREKYTYKGAHKGGKEDISAVGSYKAVPHEKGDDEFNNK